MEKASPEPSWHIFFYSLNYLLWVFVVFCFFSFSLSLYTQCLAFSKFIKWINHWHMLGAW